MKSDFLKWTLCLNAQPLKGTVLFDKILKKKLASVSLHNHEKWIDLYKNIDPSSKEELRLYYINRLKQSESKILNLVDFREIQPFLSTWQYYQPLVNEKIMDNCINTIVNTYKINKKSILENNLHVAHMLGLDMSSTSAYNLSNALLDIIAIRADIDLEEDPLHHLWDSEIHEDGDVKYVKSIIDNLETSLQYLLPKMTIPQQENIHLKLIYMLDEDNSLPKFKHLAKYETALSLIDTNMPYNTVIPLLNSIAPPYELTITNDSTLEITYE